MTSKKKAKKPAPGPLLIIGWMEQVDLPDLSLVDVKAKIDTGARTSAIGAEGIEKFLREGENWVRFRMHSEHGISSRWLEAKLYDLREIKNTSGIPERRLVIRTHLKIAGRQWPISVSLADRSNMRFPMIIGRSALKNHNIAVHTRRAYLTTNTIQ